ncbi:hypothetical protein MVEN_01107100 [Mycena venus]|uniref:MULE transposase domain-containing protein n=1 Tax=Mycena venus TaxID=2733690 RepID=A0A8H6Y863_9AGAR|nr:hypothetical protein MVEN_01107100 [Mycena venus]
MSFTSYSTPHPSTPFSTASLGTITIAQASSLVRGNSLPHILPKNSIRAWVFDQHVPDTVPEITLTAGEEIPCAEDMHPITELMEFAYNDLGARSVFLELPESLCAIRLVINVNNQASNLAAAADILDRVESSFLLLPDFIDELKGIKFSEPLAGFHVTQVPLYSLGCLLQERWANEDVLNARAELTYFHRAVAKELGNDPSFIFLPTSFIIDCRTLFNHPDRPYSQNIIWVRERVRSGMVNVIGFLVHIGDHYCALVKMRIDDLEHGDSLHLPAPHDLLRILRWAFAGLHDFAPRSSQDHISAGVIDRQRSLAGEGSCGIAAVNFVEFRVDMGIPRWMSDQSEEFRDFMLQDMLLYHLIARRKTTTYSDWVTPCVLTSNGEVPGFTAHLAVGYSDFNLDMPLTTTMDHPVFDWVVARSKQPQILPKPIVASARPEAPSTTLSSPIKLDLPARNPVPSITRLAEFPSDHTFDFSAFVSGPKSASAPSRPLPLLERPALLSTASAPPHLPPPPPQSKARNVHDQGADIIIIPDSPSPTLPSPSPPRTPPPKVKEEVLDLCSPDILDLCTPPRLATKKEVIELLSPFEVGVKRKYVGGSPSAKAEPIDLSMSSPPRRKPKRNSSPSSRSPILAQTLSSRLPKGQSQPMRQIQIASGPIQVGNIYDSLKAGERAISQEEEALGHKWIRSQVRIDEKTGAVRRHTLRCNRYRDPKETHNMDIDPSDHRQGKSGRTNCKAHVNLVAMPGGQWRISVADLAHNHEPHVPEGGSVQRPPTANQRAVAERFSDFSRKQLTDVLGSQFPNNTLEPRQISNMRNQARREAHAEIDRLGGDVQSILASLEELSSTEPGWTYSVQTDHNNVVTALWWQSPEQARLTGRYTDILINDNSYNRNDKQYPLSIGIVIDSHGRSRNAWYAFQKKEDTESFAWVLRCHLRATGDIHPELFVSDRSGALIAAVVLVFIFSFHIYCLSHLLENVDRNLGRVLAADWQHFLPDFWTCYRAVSPEDFETQWRALVQRYPVAQSYLTDLYQCRDRWAWAWISIRFTAGIRTNGRVEVENRITKGITGPGKSLFQVFKALNERTREQQRDETIRVRDASRKQHPGQTERMFKAILDVFREHVGPFALQTCFQQMQLAPFYNASALQLPEGVRDWSEYAIALNDKEPGFDWEGGEEQLPSAPEMILKTIMPTLELDSSSGSSESRDLSPLTSSKLCMLKAAQLTLSSFCQMDDTCAIAVWALT